MPRFQVAEMIQPRPLPGEIFDTIAEASGRIDELTVPGGAFHTILPIPNDSAGLIQIGIGESLITPENIDKIKERLDYVLDSHGAYNDPEMPERNNFSIEAVWQVFEQAKQVAR